MPQGNCLTATLRHWLFEGGTFVIRWNPTMHPMPHLALQDRAGRIWAAVPHNKELSLFQTLYYKYEWQQVAQYTKISEP
jgi:hypothetical protein